MNVSSYEVDSPASRATFHHGIPSPPREGSMFRGSVYSPRGSTEHGSFSPRSILREPPGDRIEGLVETSRAARRASISALRERASVREASRACAARRAAEESHKDRATQTAPPGSEDAPALVPDDAWFAPHERALKTQFERHAATLHSELVRQAKPQLELTQLAAHALARPPHGAAGRKRRGLFALQGEARPTPRETRGLGGARASRQAAAVPTRGPRRSFPATRHRLSLGEIEQWARHAFPFLRKEAPTGPLATVPSLRHKPRLPF